MTHIEFEEAEKAYRQRVEQMFNLARAVGSEYAIDKHLGELQFKTWQASLDFQNFAREQGMELRLIEAASRPVSLLSRYYRLRVPRG